MEFIRSSPNNIFDTHNLYIIKLLIRLRLGLSHPNEFKFKHVFNETINPICICRGGIETTIHCPEFTEAKQTLFDSIQIVGKLKQIFIDSLTSLE